jgi:hypothetical protein
MFLGCYGEEHKGIPSCRAMEKYFSKILEPNILLTYQYGTFEVLTASYLVLFTLWCGEGLSLSHGPTSRLYAANILPARRYPHGKDPDEANHVMVPRKYLAELTMVAFDLM